MENTLTIVLAAVSGGALTKVADFLISLLKARKENQRTDQEHISLQYRAVVETLQKQIVRIQADLDNQDEAYHAEVKQLYQENAALHARVSALETELKLLRQERGLRGTDESR